MITEKLIERTINRIVKDYKPCKIVLFGSFATKISDEDSDIDFLIVKEDVPYIGRDRIREVRREIKIEFACDILVYKPHEIDELLKLGDPFIKTIFETGRILYG